MKFYLSSYKFGDKVDRLAGMFSNKKVGLIPNALDYKGVDPIKRKISIETGIHDLNDLGLEPELLDLQDYFGKKKELRKKLDSLGGVWVRGGNTFVLRVAMKLSGFDELIHEMSDTFVYGGYSAGICILAPSLDGLQRVDKPELIDYKESHEVVWKGLGLLDYLILPHYQSDHPEAADIELEIEYCKEKRIRFRTLKDGEVIVIEK